MDGQDARHIFAYISAVVIIIVRLLLTEGDAIERLHTYSNAFLSCCNASSPCFCTTLCQLTCRGPLAIRHFDFSFFSVFNPGYLYYLGQIVITIIINSVASLLISQATTDKSASYFSDSPF